jgi:hypothetical protein
MSEQIAHDELFCHRQDWASGVLLHNTLGRGGRNALPVHPSSLQLVVAQRNGVGRMTETVEARRRRLIARIGALAETRVPLPDKIFLPDQSQSLAVIEGRAPGGKGRHFGGRRVEQPRSAWLSTRCTPAFRATVEDAAHAAGMTLADFVHVRLSGSHYEPRRKTGGADTDALRKILAQMGKQGSNLNQLAHHLNSCEGREFDDAVRAMCADHEVALAEHHAVCAAIMTALGV